MKNNYPFASWKESPSGEKVGEGQKKGTGTKGEVGRREKRSKSKLTRDGRKGGVAIGGYSQVTTINTGKKSTGLGKGGT